MASPLGSIYNFMVHKRSGRVEYAVLQFGGFLGLGSDYCPLPWDVLTYETHQRGYVVNLDKSLLERAPCYSPDKESAFDRNYGRGVYDYYGVTYPFLGTAIAKRRAPSPAPFVFWFI